MRLTGLHIDLENTEEHSEIGVDVRVPEGAPARSSARHRVTAHGHLAVRRRLPARLPDPVLSRVRTRIGSR